MYPYPAYKGAPTSWWNDYLKETIGVGDYFNPSISREYGPAAEYGMTSEELEEELKRLDRERLAGVMNSKPDTSSFSEPRPMIERQFARPIERPTRAATRGLQKGVPPVSLLQDPIVDARDLMPQRPLLFRDGFPKPKTGSSSQDPIVDPTDLLPQQSTILIGSQSVDNSPADIESIARVKAKKPKQRTTNPAALLDTAEPSAEPGSSFYDDPMRMGLIQAGLGLLSAPQYSTNMNDVAFFPTAARGISGFLQGYGGTKERLATAEREKLEDEYKRSQIEFDKLYKTALTNEAIGRTEQMQALLEQPAKDQKEWERRVREIYPGENNATAKKLIAAGPDKGPALLKELLPGVQRTETERTQLINSVNNNELLGASTKKQLIEMINETDKNGFANTYPQIQTAIKNAEEKAQPALPDINDSDQIILSPNSSATQKESAFLDRYGSPKNYRTVYNADGSQSRVPDYEVMPSSVREAMAGTGLVENREQRERDAMTNIKPPSQAQLGAKAVALEMQEIEDEIQRLDADVPLPFLGNLQNEALDLFTPDSVAAYFQSDLYKRNKSLQKEWQILVLRDESGAAIGDSEYKNYDKIYFSRPGDSPELIAAKRRARARAKEERAMIATGLRPGVPIDVFAARHAREFGIPYEAKDQTTVTEQKVDPALIDGLDLGPEDEQQYD